MHKLNRDRINRKKVSRGFSLVEIVVVIAIIGILVTLSITSMTKVRHNSANKQRQTQVKTFAAALENAAKYDETPLTCTDITGTPATVAARLELKPEDVADPKTPSQIRVSCAKKSRGNNTDSFFVSGLGCPEITIQYLQDGLPTKGSVTAKGSVDAVEPCSLDNT